MDKPQHLAIDELKSRVKGLVLESAAPDYEDTRRIWNSMIDRRPLSAVGTPATSRRPWRGAVIKGWICPFAAAATTSPAVPYATTG